MLCWRNELKIYTKNIKVLGLTKDELSMLTQMVDEAKAGHTVNYSERQTANGQFFGVSISEENRFVPPVMHRYERVANKP